MILLQNREKTAIVHAGRAFSYADLLHNAAGYAQAFSANGTPTKILIFAENSAEWIFAFWACIRLKAIAVPIDAQATPHELSYVLVDCQPEVIFTSESRRKTVNEAIEKAGVTCQIFEPKDIEIASGIEPSNIEFDDEEQTMMLIYTSGTTGLPKGVMLSYKNAMFNVDAVSKQVEIFTEKRRTMILLPLHHAFPLMGSMVAPLFVGQTVYIAAGMNVESIVATLNEGKINIIIGVPRLYELLSKGIMDIINGSILTRGMFGLARAIGSKHFSRIVFAKVHKKFGGNIDFLVSGGAALPQPIAVIFKTLGFTVLNGYGMSETAPMISFTRPWNVQVGYAGEPLPGIDVKIAENGEVCVRGANVMKGYYNRPKETADIIRDGWLHTGDTGELDPKKGLKLTGRIKEIIVTSNGKNINPEELEHEVLAQSKFIKEIGIFLKDNVLQCVIVPKLSELRDNISQIETLLKEEIAKFNQTIAPYKRLKNIHIVSGELPKTRLMKLQRFKLPELATKRKKTVENSEQPQSEIYTILKSYIDKETKSNAAPTDDFEIDLAMDSLGKVALLTYIESTFGVSMDEAQLDTQNTLEKLATFVETQQHNAATEGSKITWHEILTSKVREVVIPRAGVIQGFCSRLIKLLMNSVYLLRKSGGVALSTQPCIIVANHRSMLDGYFITSKLKSKFVKNTFFFAKDKHIRKSRLALYLARKNNVILLDINRNVREALQQMASVLKAGKNIIIFPEGTRSKTSEMLAFKESFAILSKELSVPVLPVAISGADRAFVKTLKLPRLFAKISVDFLPMIRPEKLTIEEIRTQVANVISEKLASKK